MQTYRRVNLFIIFPISWIKYLNPKERGEFLVILKWLKALHNGAYLPKAGESGPYTSNQLVELFDLFDIGLNSQNSQRSISKKELAVYLSFISSVTKESYLQKMYPVIREHYLLDEKQELELRTIVEIIPERDYFELLYFPAFRSFYIDLSRSEREEFKEIATKSNKYEVAHSLSSYISFRIECDWKLYIAVNYISPSEPRLF